MTNIQTRYHASLADEIAAILRTEGAWLSSHALLQRCTLAHDGDQLGSTLAKLVVKEQVQAHADRLGIVYGAPGMAKPVVESGREASGPASPAERPERDAPAPRADETSQPHPNSAEAKRQARLRTLVALFQEQPHRTCRELCGVLNMHQPDVSKLLRHMCEIGQIKKVGVGSQISFRWLGKPAPTVEAEPSRAARASTVATTLPPQPADTVRPTQAAAVGRAVPAEALPAVAEEAPPSVPDPAQGCSAGEAELSPLAAVAAREPSFALFSDGELLITTGPQVTRLKPSTTSALIQFLRAARGAAEFAA